MKSKWSKATIVAAVAAGCSIIGYVLEVTPTGPVGKVIGGVLKDVVPRVLGWFTKPIKEIKNDALFKAMRRPLRSRVLLEIEREKRRG